MSEISAGGGRRSLSGPAVVAGAVLGSIASINSCSDTTAPAHPSSSYVSPRLNIGGGGPIVSLLTLQAYQESFLQKHASFHDPIIPGKIMENPVMIQGDKYSYDKSSLEFWERICKESNHTHTRVAADGSLLFMNPSNFEAYYNPKTDVTENSNLKQALEENSRAIRDHYKRMFPDAIGKDRSISEIFDTIMTGMSRGGINSTIFAELDIIRKLDIFRTLRLKEPQIIVLGTENNGRSTLLERLIGYAIFPARDSAQIAGGACTICPLRVQLRRSKTEHVATIRIRNRSTKEERDHQDVPISGMTAALKKVMDGMRQNARMDNKVMTLRPSLNTLEEIVVEIHSPTCPNLDILDLPGLSAVESGALDLADEILAAEKDHSLILMVVKNYTTNQSMAPQLIHKHNLFDRTTGVYTFIDEYQNDGDLTADAALLELFKPHPDRADNHYNQIPWWGVSNIRPEGYRTMHESVRLQKTDGLEAAMVEERFPRFMDEDIRQPGISCKGRDLLGVPNLKTRLEVEFEKYICKVWTRKMLHHLTEHFYDLSDSILRLGLPMLKIDEFKSRVDSLRDLCSRNKLFPSYDFDSMLYLAGANPYDSSSSDSCSDMGANASSDSSLATIKDIVVRRAKKACANMDCLKLPECKSTIFDTLQQLENTVLPDEAMDVDMSFEEADRIMETVMRLINQLEDEILALGNTVSGSFVQAALGHKKVRFDVRPSSSSSSSASWVKLGDEKATVTVPPKTLVRYGDMPTGRVVERVMSGTFVADNNLFGDPAIGVAKTVEAHGLFKGPQASGQSVSVLFRDEYICQWVRIRPVAFLEHTSMQAAVLACDDDDDDETTVVLNPPEDQRSYSSVWNNDAIGTGHARSMLDSEHFWSAGANDMNQYMTIDLGFEKAVRGVVLQSRGDIPYSGHVVTSFTVEVSNDNVTFIPVGLMSRVKSLDLSTLGLDIPLAPVGVMFGDWIGEDVPVQAVHQLDPHTRVYMIKTSDGYTKMVTSTGEGRYYTGEMSAFCRDKWSSYQSCGTHYKLKGVPLETIPPSIQFPSYMQTSLLQLDRIPGLVESYGAFIHSKVQDINNSFRDHVAEIRDSVLKSRNGLIVKKYSLTADGKPQVFLTFAKNGGPRAIGNDLLDSFLCSLKRQLPSFSAGWHVPRESFDRYAEEVTKGHSSTASSSRKLELLEDMGNVAGAIKAIEDLQKADVKRQAALPITSAVEAHQYLCLLDSMFDVLDISALKGEAVVISQLDSINVLQDGNRAFNEDLGRLGVCEQISNILRSPALSQENGIVTKLFRMIDLLCCQKTHDGCSDGCITVNIARLAECGLLELTVSTLTTYSQSALVLKHVCCALSHLATDYRIKLGSIGCCEQLVNVLSTHQNDKSVAEKACMAIKELANDDGNKVKLGSLGCCELLVKALTTNQYDKDASYATCSAIDIMARNSNNRIELGSLGCCEQLVNVLAIHKDDEEVSIKICSAIYNMANNNSSNKLTLNALNCAAILIIVLARHRDNKLLSDCATSALQSL